MYKLVTALLLLFINSSVLAATVNNFSANYDVYQNGFYLGTSLRTLTNNKNTFTFTSVTQSGGIAAWFFDVKINETSTLIQKDNHLSISSYKYEEKQKNKHEILELKIDETQQLYNSYNKQHYPLTQNMYDGLGFSIALMHDLKNGLREVNYTIAEKEHLKSYQLKFRGFEKLREGNKTINTLKMEHFDPESKYRFTFWCAETMDFLPIRIRNVKNNGDEIVLNLSEFNQKAIYLDLENDDSGF